MMVTCPFFVIETVIFPGDKGSLSLLTPALTEKVCVFVPEVRVTLPGDVEKTTAQSVSYAKARKG